MPPKNEPLVIEAEVSKEKLAEEIQQEAEEARQRWLAKILNPLSNSFSTHKSWEEWLEQEHDQQHISIPPRSE